MMIQRIKSAAQLFAVSAIALTSGLWTAPYLYTHASPLIGSVVGIGGMALASAAVTFAIIVLAVGYD